MNIAHSHHPAARLFILTLVVGSSVFVLAIIIFFLLNHWLNPSENESIDNTPQTQNTNATFDPERIDTHTTVVETPAADISGIVEYIDDNTLMIQVRGYTENTREETLRITTNSDTTYAVVDTRTIPPPGSGASNPAHATERSSLYIGAMISAACDDTHTTCTAQSITIIE